MSKFVWYADDGKIAVLSAWHGVGPALDMIARDTGRPRAGFDYLGVRNITVMGGEVMSAHVFKPKI